MGGDATAMIVATCRHQERGRRGHFVPLQLRANSPCGGRGGGKGIEKKKPVHVHVGFVTCDRPS